MNDEAMSAEDLEWLGRLARYDAKLRQFRAVQCGGKHKFEDYHTANQSIKKSRLQRMTHVYHCSHCQGWHVGGVARSRERRLVKERIRGHED